MTGTRYSQFCALARAAEVLGERWTFLIIRELLLGPKRFSDLSQRLHGVSPTLLTARLNSLIESGVVRRMALPSPFNAQAYELTEVGRRLQPAIRELIRWGGHFLFPMRADDKFEPDWALLALDAIAARTPTPTCRIVLRIRHKREFASFVVEGGTPGTQITKGEGASEVVVETRFDTLLRIIATDLSIDEAVSGGLARVEGSIQVARALPRLFDLSERRA
jgi:DNA-binding HxlR family transcriptional regulator